MTVFDTSVVVDLLLGSGTGPAAAELVRAERIVAAPDVVVLEVLAVLRRSVVRREFAEERAAFAVDDLAAAPLVLFPSLELRQGAWALRHRMAAADALFAALAAELDEPLATADRDLANAAEAHGLTVVRLQA